MEYLVETPDVPVISFTGSTPTGRVISAAGAARLKRFGLELGGKTPSRPARTSSCAAAPRRKGLWRKAPFVGQLFSK
jgi:hypothetical protein